MSKFEFEFTTTITKKVIIEAKSGAEAFEKARRIHDSEKPRLKDKRCIVRGCEEMLRIKEY